jgi:hypothetical protein
MQATAHPALIPQEAPGRLPHAPANPRSARIGKACSRRESLPITAQPVSAMTGPSRRRVAGSSPVAPVKIPASQPRMGRAIPRSSRMSAAARSCGPEADVAEARKGNIAPGEEPIGQRMPAA